MLARILLAAPVLAHAANTPSGDDWAASPAVAHVSLMQTATALIPTGVQLSSEQTMPWSAGLPETLAGRSVYVYSSPALNMTHAIADCGEGAVAAAIELSKTYYFAGLADMMVSQLSKYSVLTSDQDAADFFLCHLISTHLTGLRTARQAPVLSTLTSCECMLPSMHWSLCQASNVRMAGTTCC